MAKILYSNVVTAADNAAETVDYEIYESAMKVENLKRLDQDATKVATLPDRRAYRSMNRSAVILAAACLPAKEFIDSNIEDRFRTGFYCANDNGPDNYQCAKGAPQNKSDEFATYYKKNRSPKDYLKQLPNLVPAQIAIFLELLGPLNVYNNSNWGALQALEQAEFDLNSGLVDRAVVAASYSLDDPLRARRRRSEVSSDKSLTEGAAILILGKGDEKQKWSSDYETLPNDSNYYGIADPVVRFASTTK